MSAALPQSSLCVLAEAYVRQELAGNDASHDWHHIARVRALALSLASEEGVQSPSTVEVVELSALLHDVADWKYSGSETAGIEAARAFLTKHNYPAEKVDLVCHLIDQVGFKSELKRQEDAAAGIAAAAPPAGAAAAAQAEGADITLLLGLVQDADRLDAIGAVGIGRCFTYGGHKKRPMYDPDVPVESEVSHAGYKAAAVKGGEPTINHFHQKLLKLRDMMKTKAGKARADKRHQVMVDFLETFQLEVEGKA